MTYKIINPLKHNNKFEQIIIYDTETGKHKIDYELDMENTKIGYTHKLKLAVINFYMKQKLIKNKSTVIYNEKEAIEHFKTLFNERKIDTSKPLYIFAHNHIFDFLILGKYILNYLTEIDYIIEFKTFDPFIIVLRKKLGEEKFTKIIKGKEKEYTRTHYHKIIFLDTINYYVGSSIKKLGTAFNLPKGKIDFDNCTVKELESYCFRDVEITAKAIFHLLKFMQNTKIGYTIGQCAMNLFRTKYMKFPLFVIENKKIKEHEINSYYGGRTECFRIGKFNNLVKLDVNSLYPTAMLNRIPVKCIRYIEYPNKDYFFKLLTENKYLLIAEVKVKNLNEPKIPHRTKDKLIFPIGNFTSTLCTPELKLVKENIVNINKLSVYESEYIFNEYINDLYEKKQSSRDETMRILYKYFLNALYGKFGQRNIKQERIREYDNYLQYGKILDADWGFISFFNGLAYREIKEEREEVYHTFTAISSFICSYARTIMYNYIDIAKIENCYYMDTDSLFVNQKGFNNLSRYIDDKKLGFLKIEDKGNCEIRNLKDYIFNDYEKIKGVGRNYKLDKDNNYVINRFSGIKESMNKFDSNIVELEVTKHLNRIYNKGIVKNSYVKPFKLNEV